MILESYISYLQQLKTGYQVTTNDYLLLGGVYINTADLCKICGLVHFGFDVVLNVGTKGGYQQNKELFHCRIVRIVSPLCQ